MLKITIYKDEPARFRFVLEGKLMTPWTKELRKSWCSCSAETRSGSVDLTGVTFIDEAGERLLGEIYRDGAKLDGQNLLIGEMVKKFEAK
ncbi:MAG: hypothetical protein IT174_12675 [Acidobacteria bacterium]|nr:hypothetical protein [Acidobacteriota bacterium]